MNVLRYVELTLNGSDTRPSDFIKGPDVVV